MKKFEQWSKEHKAILSAEFGGSDIRSIENQADFVLRIMEISRKENKEKKS